MLEAEVGAPGGLKLIDWREVRRALGF